MTKCNILSLDTWGVVLRPLVDQNLRLSLQYRSPGFAYFLASHLLNSNAANLPDLSCCPWDRLKSWTLTQYQKQTVSFWASLSPRIQISPNIFSISSILDTFRRIFCCIEGERIIIHQSSTCLQYRGLCMSCSEVVIQIYDAASIFLQKDLEATTLCKTFK